MSSAGGAAVFILSFYILKRERERETETCATTLMLDSREQHRFFVVVSRGMVSFFCCVFIFGDNGFGGDPKMQRTRLERFADMVVLASRPAAHAS